MAFNVIDGFNVNAAAPVDYRLVVANTTLRDALQYKYNGLPVFVEADRKTYIWNSTTSDWDVSFFGISDRVAVINSVGNGITASIIQHGSDGITFLNTNTYITTLGTMSIIGGTGVSSKGGTVIITGGYAGSPNTGGDVYINSGALTGNLYFLAGSGRIGIGTTVFSAGINLQISPTTEFNSSVRFIALSEANSGIVFNSTVPFGSVTSAAKIKSNNLYSTIITGPDYTWQGNENTGIYHPAANTVGISVNGVASGVFAPANVSLAANGATALSLTTLTSKLSFGGNTVSISSDRVAFNIVGAVPYYQSGFPDKMLVMANDILANVHQQGTNGIGDSGNYTYAPDGLGSGTGPWQFPSIASGLYTLSTSGNPVNVSSVFPAGYTNWIRVGNVISVTGQVGFNVTVANTDSSFTMTLPVKSYFGNNNYWQLSGVGKIVNVGAANTGGGDVITIQAAGNIAGNNLAKFSFRPTSTGSKTITYHYQYVVATYVNSPAPVAPPPLACFVADTLVTMADGTFKPIQDILLGDIVLSWNFETSELEKDEVLEVVSPYHDDIVAIEFIDRNSDRTINFNTFDHPYYVKNKGLCSYNPDLTRIKYGIIAEQLTPGDECYKYSNGELSTVIFRSAIERMGNVKTYNIKTLRNNRSYFANGILVDNESTVDIPNSFILNESTNLVQE